jgi:HSP20 family molecular chaperone IbpA
MRTVGYHPLPPHARVRTTEHQYVIELDVPDFTTAEISVETQGPVVTVVGEQHENEADAGRAFTIRERLEETFRLPDDVDLEQVAVFHKHGVLELRVVRRPVLRRRLPIARRRPGLLNGDAEAV